ncbi:MAG: branched-chain amino acid ABC transporter permease [Bacillota bacterium]|nr:branched-chain amino acid ABC transporter permease [Bacillota bacterium]
MIMVLQLLVNGIALGCIYGLVALGIALIWNAARTLNFAQGDILMLGAYLGYTALALLRLPYWLGFILVAVLTILFGILFQRVAYYPLRNRPFILVVVSTIGISIFLRNAAQISWGNAPVYFPILFRGIVKLGPINLVPQNLFIIIVMVLVMSALYSLFYRTKLGKMLRATAQDQEAAHLMGIEVQWMIALTFALSSLLAGVAGVLLGPIFFLEPYMGGIVTMRAFIASVVGGFGSIPGAVIGGIIVGLVELFSAAYISSMYKDVFVFGLCVLFIVFRPSGLFGESVGEKA